MQKQWRVAVTAESLAAEQTGETYAPTVLPSNRGSSQTERNQTLEDNPEKVSRQTATEMHTICFIKPHGRTQVREKSVTLVTVPFHSRGNPLRVEHLDLGGWNSLCFFFSFLFFFSFFAYSDTHKFTIQLRLNFKWCHYWYCARP